MSDLVHTERHPDGVTVLTLNRPEKHNALSDLLLDQLSDALLAVRDDADARVLVVTGAGERAFCAGRDMTEGVGRARATGDAPPRTDAFTLLREMSIPTIAAINGYAFGGGALLALMCDLRVAAPSATFRFPGAAYGLAVATGLLAALIGPARAKDLIFSTRVVDAREALMLGLVNEVADGDVKERVRVVAAGIAGQSPGALVASKRLIDRVVRPEELARAEAEENRALRTAEQANRFAVAAQRITGGRPRGAGSDR